MSEPARKPSSHLAILPSEPGRTLARERVEALTIREGPSLEPRFGITEHHWPRGGLVDSGALVRGLRQRE